MISEIIIKISTCYQDDLRQDSDSRKCYVLPREKFIFLIGSIAKDFVSLAFIWKGEGTDRLKVWWFVLVNT